MPTAAAVSSSGEQKKWKIKGIIIIIQSHIFEINDDLAIDVQHQNPEYEEVMDLKEAAHDEAEKLEMTQYMAYGPLW